MSKQVAAILFFLAMSVTAIADEVTGFWKTINENSGRAESIVAIYKYRAKYYGRIIVTFKPDGTVRDTIYNQKERAPGVEGEPFYTGIDIIWDLRKKGPKYTNGSIIDPEKGYIYGAEIWRDGKDLIVRGELLFLGRNQRWIHPVDTDYPADFKMPDVSAFVPVIPVPRTL